VVISNAKAINENLYGDLWQNMQKMHHAFENYELIFNFLVLLRNLHFLPKPYFLTYMD